MDYTAIETKLLFLFLCFVTFFYDILRYTVPKTQRAVLLDIWFDVMSLRRHISYRAFGTDNHYLHQNILKGFFKKKLFYYVCGRVKSKTLVIG